MVGWPWQWHRGPALAATRGVAAAWAAVVLLGGGGWLPAVPVAVAAAQGVGGVPGGQRPDAAASREAAPSPAANLLGVPTAAPAGRAAPAAPAVAAAATPVPAATTRWGAGYLPNVPLTTHHGKTVRLYDDLLKGKRVAIATMYTTCSQQCPLITARMKQLRDALGERFGRDVHFISLSIDPLDTAESLREYAAKFGAGGPGWEFVTGRAEDVALVTRKLGLARANDRLSADGHTDTMMVGDVDAGRWMRNSAVDHPEFLAVTILNFFGLRDGLPGPSYAQAQPVVLDPGRRLFQSRCEGCHTLGRGDRIGPDLAGLTQRRERHWVARYIVDPARLRTAQDPAALELARRYAVRMPAQALSHEELGQVLVFLEKATGSRGPLPAAAR